MISIGVCGSRSFDDRGFVWAILDGFLKENGEFTLVSGGAKGPDTFAEDWAMTRGLKTKIFHAEWSKIDAPGAVIKVNSRGKEYNAMAGFDRNHKIVTASDYLLAFMDPDAPTPGTSHTIQVARAKPILVIVYYPNKLPIFYRVTNPLVV